MGILGFKHSSKMNPRNSGSPTERYACTERAGSHVAGWKVYVNHVVHRIMGAKRSCWSRFCFQKLHYKCV